MADGRVWCAICGKWGYPTEAAAVAALWHAKQNPDKVFQPVRFYRSPACRIWHLTKRTWQGRR